MGWPWNKLELVQNRIVLLKYNKSLHWNWIVSRPILDNNETAVKTEKQEHQYTNIIKQQTRDKNVYWAFILPHILSLFPCIPYVLELQ